jgi:diacylglycerol kinase family enzyme
VSGDGLIHEVVNGLYRRNDWMQFTSKTTIGFIPGGSANGLVKAVLDYSSETYSVENAAFIVSKGRRTRMDLTEIEGEYEPEKIYSFLSIAWAVIADCDINSEFIRCVGTARFTLWGIFRVFCKKNYHGSLNYTGYKVTNELEFSPESRTDISPELPEINEVPVSHLNLPDQYNNCNFSHVIIQNTPFIGSSIKSCPLSRMDDGMNDVRIN